MRVEAGLGALWSDCGSGESRGRATGVLGQERLKLGDEGRIVLASTKAFSSWSRAGMRIWGNTCHKFTEKRIEQGVGYLPLHSAIEDLGYEPWRAEAYGWGTYMSSTKFTKTD